MGAYQKLCSIADTTKEDREFPLEVWIRQSADDPDKLWLWIVQVQRDDQGRFKSRKVLVSVPFEPGEEDEAAEDASRHLTLDGEPPEAMA